MGGHEDEWPRLHQSITIPCAGNSRRMQRGAQTPNRWAFFVACTTADERHLDTAGALDVVTGSFRMVSDFMETRSVKFVTRLGVSEDVGEE